MRRVACDGVVGFPPGLPRSPFATRPSSPCSVRAGGQRRKPRRTGAQANRRVGASRSLPTPLSRRTRLRATDAWRGAGLARVLRLWSSLPAVCRPGSPRRRFGTLRTPGRGASLVHDVPPSSTSSREPIAHVQALRRRTTRQISFPRARAPTRTLADWRRAVRRSGRCRHALRQRCGAHPFSIVGAWRAPGRGPIARARGAARARTQRKRRERLP